MRKNHIIISDKSSIKYAIMRDAKSSGTAGGTFASGQQTRVLNEILADDYGIIYSLSSNAFILGAGTYIVSAKAQAQQVDGHQLILRNTSDSTNLLSGISSTAAAAGDANMASMDGQFTITATKTLELNHFANSAKATNGFGSAVTAGVNEIYATVELWKIDR